MDTGGGARSLTKASLGVMKATAQRQRLGDGGDSKDGAYDLVPQLALGRARDTWRISSRAILEQPLRA